MILHYGPQGQQFIERVERSLWLRQELAMEMVASY